MKKLLILFLLTSTIIQAQDICKNRYGAGKLVYAGLKQKNTVVYLTAQYVDKGLGLRIDRNLNKDLALYGSVSKGNYWTMGMHGEIPHYKFATGVVYCNNVLPLMQPRLTAGVSFHAMEDVSWNKLNYPAAHDWEYYLPDKSGNISFELGIGMVVAGWVAVGYRFDIIRHEGNAEIGISFKL
jgi:hypothetical protein